MSLALFAIWFIFKKAVAVDHSETFSIDVYIDRERENVGERVMVEALSWQVVKYLKFPCEMAFV